MQLRIEFSNTVPGFRIPLSRAEKHSSPRLVIESYLKVQEGCALDSNYKLILLDDEQQTVLHSGTLRDAYLALTLPERIDMFMGYCYSDFSNCPSLPEKVKDILRLRPLDEESKSS